MTDMKSRGRPSNHEKDKAIYKRYADPYVVATDLAKTELKIPRSTLYKIVRRVEARFPEFVSATKKEYADRDKERLAGTATNE